MQFFMDGTIFGFIKKLSFQGNIQLTQFKEGHKKVTLTDLKSKLAAHGTKPLELRGGQVGLENTQKIALIVTLSDVIAPKKSSKNHRYRTNNQPQKNRFI